MVGDMGIQFVEWTGKPENLEETFPCQSNMSKPTTALLLKKWQVVSRIVVRRFLYMLFALTLCATQSGCIVFYSYQKDRVTVRDAETDTPIPGAEVTVDYPYVMLLNRPQGTSAVTDEQGNADLRAATLMQTWSVESKGYLREKPPFWSGCNQTHGRELEFRMYREPAPHITVIVTTGYRGPLKIDKTAVAQSVQDFRGKREFTFHASSNGYVGIDATPLLLRGDTFPISAMYENGQTIPWADYRVTPAEDALRFVDGDAFGKRELYVIGSEQDVEHVNARIYNFKNGDPHNLSLNATAFDKLFDER